MNRMKKRKLTKYVIVNKKLMLQGVGYFCLNQKLTRVENHLARLREIYLSKPEEFPYMPGKILDAEHRRRQLEELLTGYFNLIVVVEIE